jgi:hypothetical protein
MARRCLAEVRRENIFGEEVGVNRQPTPKFEK